MKAGKTVEIFIPSELGYEKVVINALAALAGKLGFSPDRIDDLKTALAEAVTNAIEHGNRLNVELRVAITARIEEHALVLDVTDQGPLPLPDLPGVRQERPDHRGIGMFLIHNLVDEVRILAKPGQNVLQMVLNRPQ